MLEVDGFYIEFKNATYHKSDLACDGFWLFRFTWNRSELMAMKFENMKNFQIFDVNKLMAGESPKFPYDPRRFDEVLPKPWVASYIFMDHANVTPFAKEDFLDSLHYWREYEQDHLRMSE